MRIFDDITPALQAIARSWSTRDTSVWFSFIVDEDKVPGIDAKWTEIYGIRLSSEKRRYRKRKGLPTAWAASIPVLGNPYKRQLILMASEEAVRMPKDSPWGREKWRRDPPEVSDFVMVKEPRERGDYAWTWRIQNKAFSLVEAHLIALVKDGDAGSVAEYSHYITRFYFLRGGIRRQVKRLLHSGRKLWIATRRNEWPGPDPDNLPFTTGFVKENRSLPRTASDPGATGAAPA